MNILCELAKLTTEILTGVFSGPEPSNESVEDITYNYWMNLSYQDQQDYFKRNLVLQQYGENYRYDDRWQMAKSAANIARLEHRAFNNKYDRY